MKHPDPARPYVLFTDASNYAWAGVLTQPYDEVDPSNLSTDNKPTKRIHHPITYVSGLFKGSQLNWAALTKEAYAIYLSVRKFSFYLTGADILIRSDHLPLKQFLSQALETRKLTNGQWDLNHSTSSLNTCKASRIPWQTHLEE